MEKLKKIPVIGYILRVIIAVCKLPKHIDNLYQVLGEHREDNLEAIKRLQEQNDKLQKQNADLEKKYVDMNTYKQNLQTQCKELIRWNTDRMQEIAGLQNVVDRNFNELKQWNADRMQEIRALQNFEVDESYIKKMNLVRSIYPTLWGDSERLHISELASVGSCFFNTNSGHITIGDYTFSGSGVSILAGSHDMRLTGLPRRDCELKEGCDISIGKGVWLASNCTILGPAVIEDNAVIAAGAVVTPGTHVPSGMVYGGVPARKIADIKCCSDNDWEVDAYKKALKRENGILFVEGWTEKREVYSQGVKYIGHYMSEDKAIILTSKLKVTFFYQIEESSATKLLINDRIYELQQKSGIVSIDVSKELQKIYIVNQKAKDTIDKIFIAAIDKIQKE